MFGPSEKDLHDHSPEDGVPGEAPEAPSATPTAPVEHLKKRKDGLVGTLHKAALVATTVAAATGLFGPGCGRAENKEVFGPPKGPPKPPPPKIEQPVEESELLKEWGGSEELKNLSKELNLPVTTLNEYCKIGPGRGALSKDAFVALVDLLRGKGFFPTSTASPLEVKELNYKIYELNQAIAGYDKTFNVLYACRLRFEGVPPEKANALIKDLSPDAKSLLVELLEMDAFSHCFKWRYSNQGKGRLGLSYVARSMGERVSLAVEYADAIQRRCPGIELKSKSSKILLATSAVHSGLPSEDIVRYNARFELLDVRSLIVKGIVPAAANGYDPRFSCEQIISLHGGAVPSEEANELLNERWGEEKWSTSRQEVLALAPCQLKGIAREQAHLILSRLGPYPFRNLADNTHFYSDPKQLAEVARWVYDERITRKGEPMEVAEVVESFIKKTGGRVTPENLANVDARFDLNTAIRWLKQGGKIGDSGFNGALSREDLNTLVLYGVEPEEANLYHKQLVANGLPAAGIDITWLSVCRFDPYEMSEDILEKNSILVTLVYGGRPTYKWFGGENDVLELSWHPSQLVDWIANLPTTQEKMEYVYKVLAYVPGRYDSTPSATVHDLDSAIAMAIAENISPEEVWVARKQNPHSYMDVIINDLIAKKKPK